MTNSTITSTIATQVSEFNVGFDAAVGPEIAAVFAAEQSGLNSAGVPTGAISVGQKLPDAALLDPSGVSTSLYYSLGAGPAVIVFYRGAWCPYCNIVLRHYQAELLPALRARGIALVAISPQTPEGTDAAITNGSLEFTVLSDPGNALASSLGIVTIPTVEAREAHTALGFAVADSNADATANIPFPTVLVVDAGRVVTFADVHVDYTTRTEVSEILAALGV
jgi:peroxiredoxin